MPFYGAISLAQHFIHVSLKQQVFKLTTAIYFSSFLFSIAGMIVTTTTTTTIAPRGSTTTVVGALTAATTLAPPPIPTTSTTTKATTATTVTTVITAEPVFCVGLPQPCLNGALCASSKIINGQSSSTTTLAMNPSSTTTTTTATLAAGVGGIGGVGGALMYCSCPAGYGGVFCEIPPDPSSSAFVGNAPAPASENDTKDLFWLFLLAPLLLVGGVFFRKRRSGSAALNARDLENSKGASALGVDGGHSAVNLRNSLVGDEPNQALGATGGWMPVTTTAFPGEGSGGPRPSAPNVVNNGMGFRTRSYENAMHELQDHTLPHFGSEGNFHTDISFSLPIQQEAHLAAPDQMNVRHSFMVDHDADTVRLKSTRRNNPLFAPQGSSNRSIQLMDLFEEEEAGGPANSPSRPISFIATPSTAHPTRSSAAQHDVGRDPEILLADPTSVPTSQASAAHQNANSLEAAPAGLGIPSGVVPSLALIAHQLGNSGPNGAAAPGSPTSVPTAQASAAHQNVNAPAGLGVPSGVVPSLALVAHQLGNSSPDEAAAPGSPTSISTAQASAAHQNLNSPEAAPADLGVPSGVVPSLALLAHQLGNRGPNEAAAPGSPSSAPTAQASAGHQGAGASRDMLLAGPSGVPTSHASVAHQNGVRGRKRTGQCQARQRLQWGTFTLDHCDVTPILWIACVIELFFHF